jgi:hypothetical protein
MKILFRCPICCTVQDLLGEYAVFSEAGQCVKYRDLSENYIHYCPNVVQNCTSCGTKFLTAHLEEAQFIAEVYGDAAEEIQKWLNSFE